MPDRRKPNKDFELLGSEINLLKVKAADTDKRVDLLIKEFNEYKDENRTIQNEMLVTVLENQKTSTKIGGDVEIIVEWTKNFAGFVKVATVLKNATVWVAKASAAALILGAIAQTAYTVIIEDRSFLIPDVIPNNKEVKSKD